MFFWNSLAFLMMQWMLAISPLFPLTDPSRESKKWNREIYYSQILEEVHGLKEPHRKSRQCVDRVLAAGSVVNIFKILGRVLCSFLIKSELVNSNLPKMYVCLCEVRGSLFKEFTRAGTQVVEQTVSVALEHDINTYIYLQLFWVLSRSV